LHWIYSGTTPIRGRLSVGFSDRAVTAWGGLALLKRILDSLGFREAVGNWGLPTPGSNRGYAPVQLIEHLIDLHFDGHKVYP
jgi:hypothetical protein